MDNGLRRIVAIMGLACASFAATAGVLESSQQNISDRSSIERQWRERCVESAGDDPRHRPTIFEGYRASGYRGALEPDSIWSRSVREHHLPDKTLYSMRYAPSPYGDELYESIEPVSDTTTFVAMRKGCAALLDAQGRVLIDQFNKYESVYLHDAKKGQGMVLRLTRGAPDEWGFAFYTYVRIRAGRIAARAPQWYASGICSQAGKAVELNEKWPVTLRAFTEVCDGDNHWGLLRLADLKEIIPTAYEGVGQLTVGMVDSPASALFAVRRGALKFFNLDGRPLDVPDAQRFDTYWVNFHEATDYVVLFNDTEKTCHIYVRPLLTALIDEAIPIVRGDHCPEVKDPLYVGAPGLLEFSDKQGKRRRYQVDPNGLRAHLLPD